MVPFWKASGFTSGRKADVSVLWYSSGTSSKQWSSILNKVTDVSSLIPCKFLSITTIRCHITWIIHQVQYSHTSAKKWSFDNQRVLQDDTAYMWSAGIQHWILNSKGVPTLVFQTVSRCDKYVHHFTFPACSTYVEKLCNLHRPSNSVRKVEWKSRLYCSNGIIKIKMGKYFMDKSTGIQPLEGLGRRKKGNIKIIHKEHIMRTWSRM